MSFIQTLVKQELIQLNCTEDCLEDFFAHQANKLYELGYVKVSFDNALKKRELEYPTGLELEYISIAIPHTDPKHVEHPFISICRLKKQSIPFIQMGTSDVVVYPQIIFILGITQPKNQVAILSELMELCSNEQFVQKLVRSSTVEEIEELFI